MENKLWKKLIFIKKLTFPFLISLYDFFSTKKWSFYINFFFMSNMLRNSFFFLLLLLNESECFTKFFVGFIA